MDAALLGNETYRAIAKRFGASESAIFRHQREHLPSALVKARDASELTHADSLMEKITQLEQEATRLGKKAEDAGDLRGAMAAVRELVRIVELLAKIQGEIKDPGGTTIQVVYVNAPGLMNSNGRSARPAESSESDTPAKSTIVDVTHGR